MITQPLISVIMPAYNEEAVLADAIESVLAQTHDLFELILVDDASTDATLSIMMSYASVDKRIKVIQNPENSRQALIRWEPRNDGLRIARGTFIAYLDADNSWSACFLEKLGAILIDDDSIMLVHCDSTNHHSAEECRHVISIDKRRLVSHDETTTLFSYEKLEPSKLGYEIYIDTNEIMHRSSIFAGLGCLWRTEHPSRENINWYQGSRRPYRRHNDLDLVQRVIDVYGVDSIHHLAEPLVDYYYPSAERPATKGRAFGESVGTKAPISPDVARRLDDLNVAHFYGQYLGTNQRANVIRHDFGLGEIKGVEGVNLVRWYKEFIDSGGPGERMLKYGGTAGLNTLFEQLAAGYNRFLGSTELKDVAITAFDGCHNAIYTAVSVLAGPSLHSGRHAIAYAVPAYPYWSITAAARQDSLPITAYNMTDFISALERTEAHVGAIIVNSPHNPMGWVLTASEAVAINRLAQRRQCGIIADIAYHSFEDTSDQQAGLAALDPQRTVYCDSVSKTWGMPGLRLGFAFTYNRELSAALRAVKSGQSLLPSSIKQTFLHYLLMHHADGPSQIAETICNRKQLAWNTLRQADLAEHGMELVATHEHGFYVMIYIDKLCQRSGLTPRHIAEHLAREHSIRVMADESFFPVSLQARIPRRFLRLSFGCIEAVEAGIDVLLEALVSLWTDHQ
ncbi:MAG: aminotransferase class I/II-fold pyridoxal phosphate-dependent enzyme [candidate division Zixibacteria bacterium]|nr:aminotransferase class I/II-fold pyridoxal phosphate-dependent enzyme [candidate division Zixibacteria bacterium]MDH3935850.1 aminotransferase class I/II-fold pyridoxal phosphate-dependent enzyme [candidate division Zixibacteria bacterium]MDH4033751.1 aminotransferase class I/II-fold pyridoxal phosphate-dependent enzyme [candidate division Zixibacteria bacterium]